MDKTRKINGLTKVIQGQPNYKGVFHQCSFLYGKKRCIVVAQILFFIAPWKEKNKVEQNIFSGCYTFSWKILYYNHSNFFPAMKTEEFYSEQRSILSCCVVCGSDWQMNSDQSLTQSHLKGACAFKSLPLYLTPTLPSEIVINLHYNTKTNMAAIAHTAIEGHSRSAKLRLEE